MSIASEGMPIIIESKIAGVTYDDPVNHIPRQQIIRRFLRRGMELMPRLEPDNPHDENAVALWIVGKPFLGKPKEYHVGYVGAQLSQGIANYLRAGRSLMISVSEVTGGTFSRPTRGVNIVIAVAR